MIINSIVLILTPINRNIKIDRKENKESETKARRARILPNLDTKLEPVVDLRILTHQD